MLFFLLSSLLFLKNNIENHPISINQEQQLEINCTNFLNYSFKENGINFSCPCVRNGDINIFYEYDEFIKYQINSIYTEYIYFYLDDVYDNLPDKFLTKIISSINLTGYQYDYCNIIFFGPLNVTKIEKYLTLFPIDSRFSYDFNIAFYSDGCYWEKKGLLPINFIEYEKIKDHWKNVCISTNDKITRSMFHYTNDDEIVKIKYIGSKQILIISIVVVLVVILILATSFGIVIYRYNKANKHSRQD